MKFLGRTVMMSARDWDIPEARKVWHDKAIADTERYAREHGLTIVTPVECKQVLYGRFYETAEGETHQIECDEAEATFVKLFYEAEAR